LVVLDTIKGKAQRVLSAGEVVEVNRAVAVLDEKPAIHPMFVTAFLT